MTPRRATALIITALLDTAGLSAASALGSLALVGCGSATLAVPLRGHQVGVDPVPVPFPPPPARADIIPDQPADATDPVWERHPDGSAEPGREE